MYKIDNLKTLVAEHVVQPLDGFTIDEDMKKLTSKLMQIETAFQDIKNQYVINVEPVLPTQYNKESHLTTRLEFDGKVLFKDSTMFSLVNFAEDKVGVFHQRSKVGSADCQEEELAVREEVYFKKEPSRYIEVMENLLIKAFLENEKSLVKEHELVHTVNQLRNGASYSRKTI